MARLLLLGPQRLRPTVGAALAGLGEIGSVVTVTAGWQENEGEDETLRRELGVSSVNLGLYARAERLFVEASGLFAALRRRQERLKELQRLYRRRLDHALDAYRELRGLAGDSELVVDERDAALDAVRALDAHHLERVRQVRGEYDERHGEEQRHATTRDRDELEARLAEADAVVIAGGHVAVLLNRLRLFDLPSLLADRTIVGWGAGAMILGERIVLFHDSPPWGAGNAEVLDHGLGLCREVLPLPHSRRRLRLDDAQRVALFARRFSPLRCAGMDEGARIEMGAAGWRGSGVQLLEPGGSVRLAGGVDVEGARS